MVQRVAVVRAYLCSLNSPARTGAPNTGLSSSDRRVHAVCREGRSRQPSSHGPSEWQMQRAAEAAHRAVIERLEQRAGGKAGAVHGGRAAGAARRGRPHVSLLSRQFSSHRDPHHRSQQAGRNAFAPYARSGDRDGLACTDHPSGRRCAGSKRRARYATIESALNGWYSASRSATCKFAL
jgi:hypothetical protein